MTSHADEAQKQRCQPMLMGLLSDERFAGEHRDCIELLGKIGTNAAAALPLLNAKLPSARPTTRQSIETALVRIAPLPIP